MTTQTNTQIALTHLTEISAHQQVVILAIGGFLNTADATIRSAKLQLMQAACDGLQDEVTMLRAALLDEPLANDLEVRYLDANSANSCK